VLAAAAIAILTAPWWVTIFQRHGIDPFLAAGATARQDSYNPLVGLIVLFRYYFTDEPFTAIFASIGLIGLFRLLAQRNFLMPTWFFAAHLLEPRGGTLYMMIPLSIAAGVALSEIILPGFSPTKNTEPNRPAILTSIFLVILFFYGTFSANFASSKILSETTLKPAELDAFDWVRENTPAGSRFVIISAGNALRDPTSEWFPSITLRKSQATIFGYEWVNDGRFAQRKQQYTLLQDCAFQSVTCLEQWRQNNAPGFNYVYVRKTQSDVITLTPLEIFLRQSAQYRIVYETMQVNIFERLESQ
jgi:hypothetical protein